MTSQARAPFVRMSVRGSAFLICCAVSINALAASNNSICDESVRRDLQNLEIPAQDLSLAVVDHFPVEDAAPLAEAEDLPEVSFEAVTPTLTLSPRVASILDYVFSYGDDEAGQALAQADDEVRVTVEDTPTQEDATTSPEAQINATTADDELEIPQLQNRMFRRDI